MDKIAWKCTKNVTCDRSIPDDKGFEAKINRSQCNARMLDGGLRVSEVMKLRVKHINTLSKTVHVESLKKRKPEHR